MEYIILFEEDSLEISFSAYTVVMMSLPNCCYEGAKKSHKRSSLSCALHANRVENLFFLLYQISQKSNYSSDSQQNRTE